MCTRRETGGRTTYCRTDKSSQPSPMIAGDDERSGEEKRPSPSRVVPAVIGGFRVHIREYSTMTDPGDEWRTREGNNP
jgi:hypothetical protein